MLRCPSLALAYGLVVSSLASAQVQAYLVDSDLDLLFRVDLGTGAATSIASTSNNNLTTPAGLEWREDTGELWTIDLIGGEVGTIHTTSGSFTPRFQTQQNGWQAIAWDPFTSRFYLAWGTPAIYALDPVSGVSSLLATNSTSMISCLDVDSTGDLFGLEFSTGFIVRIDKSTGIATRTVQTLAGFQGLGIDPSSGVWYASNSNIDGLYRIDPTTGAATWIGLHGSGIGFAKGLEVIGTPGLRVRGRGCTDATGAIFRMSASGVPRIGQSVSIGGIYAALAPYWLVGGVSDRNWLAIPLPLDLGPFGAIGCIVYASQDLVLGPLPNGGTITTTIPNQPAIVGTKTFWQGLQVDGAISRPLPMATSNLLEITILP
jgi:hypothetical protein